MANSVCHCFNHYRYIFRGCEVSGFSHGVVNSPSIFNGIKEYYCRKEKNLRISLPSTRIVCIPYATPRPAIPSPRYCSCAGVLIAHFYITSSLIVVDKRKVRGFVVAAKEDNRNFQSGREIGGCVKIAFRCGTFSEIHNRARFVSR